MDFYTVLDQVLALLRQRGRVSYRALKRQFGLDDAYLNDLKVELIEVHQCARDQEGTMLVWTGEAASAATPESVQAPAPLTYTPIYLAEKILTSRSALEGERKQVTVLFADLKGSTELIEGLDPEDARTLLDPALHVMMDAVHRYEGTVNQVLGDGIMALFGAPVAHEDHALRACYAALAMQAAMRRYAEEVRRSHGLEIQARVGLNSGEVVVRAIGNDLHMDYSAVGQTTHLAARMEQLATPGSIRLTAVTLRLAEGLVQVNALGPFPVKGLTDPVEVFELVGASAIRRRLQASVARGLTRFVGRQQELLALQQALEQAGACHGQIVAVVGEVGVGKSRLVYEFIHSHHTQGWSVLESASVSYGKATPYFPVIDLLKRYSHIEDHDDTRAIRAKLTGQVLTLDTALQDVIPVLLALLDAAPEDSPFLTLDPGQRRQHTLDALKRLLLRESQVQPLLLVFEDLHWIDSETQALLNSLVESLPTTQVLLLVNYRPEYQHGWGSKTYYTQLRLDPLPPVSADEFLYALLGNDPSLAPVTRLLIARTEGNPFFLEESVRTLIETGVLVGEPGAYRLAQALPTIQIPTSVQAVLAARIDRLSADEKRLLQAAAVIGTEVRVPLLEAIAELPEATLYRGLAHLQAAEFLYETRLFPERAYTFKHALTQQVAYQSLLMRTRQRYHQQLAQVLAAQPEMVETQPELLAHHYTEAGLTAPAVTYWQRAGQRASERSAHLEAISHFTRGLEVLQALPDTAERAQHELHLQTALASVCIAVKGMGAAEVEQAYTRAHMLCQQVGDTSQLLLVLQGLRRFYTGRNDHQRVREIGEQLLHLGQRLHDPAVLLEAHLALGLLMRHLGELVAAHGHLEQALALYDRQAHRTLALRHGRDPGVSSRNFLILTLWLLGYPDQALQRSHEAITLAQELAHPYSLVLALSFAARHAHLLRREARAAQELAETAIALCTMQGFAQWLAENTLVCGWALTVQGQGEAGIAQLRQALAAFDATGASVRPYQLAMLAEAYGTTGQAEAGLVTLAEAFAAMHTTGERVWEAQLYQLKGELLLQAGGQACEADAVACLHHALAVARRQQAKSWELRAAMSLSRLWQQQGKQAEACTLLASIYGWFTEGFDTADLQEAKALLEILA